MSTAMVGAVWSGGNNSGVLGVSFKTIRGECPQFFWETLNFNIWVSKLYTVFLII